MDYQQTANTIRNLQVTVPVERQGKLRELVRYAILAPSGHNTQCWKFRLGADAITVAPDFSRRTNVVDPDDHHLYVSLGCAVETICQAAPAFGLEAEAHCVPDDRGDKGDKGDKDDNGEVTIRFSETDTRISPLFEAITQRQCTRNEYDGSSLAPEQLDALRLAGTGHGVSVRLLTDPQRIGEISDFVIRANSLQLNNSSFRRELENWVRFSDRMAMDKGDGLSARVMGHPPAPQWLGRLVFRLTLRGNAENRKLVRQIRSSSGIAIFVSARDDWLHWIEAGRCYQRFALLATSMGVMNAFINQPVEVAEVRERFATVLGFAPGRPDLVVRFGRSNPMPYSLRRPVASVIHAGEK